jgi:hypothetical protein
MADVVQFSREGSIRWAATLLNRRAPHEQPWPPLTCNCRDRSTCWLQRRCIVLFISTMEPRSKPVDNGIWHFLNRQSLTEILSASGQVPYRWDPVQLTLRYKVFHPSFLSEGRSTRGILELEPRSYKAWKQTCMGKFRSFRCSVLSSMLKLCEAKHST